MAATLNKLGDVYAGRKQYDQALEQYRRALGIRHVRGESHPGVALAYHNIGNIHKIQGRYDDALRDMEQALLALREPGREPATLEGLEAGDLRPLPLTVEVLHDWARLLESSLGATSAISQLRRCSRLYRLAGGVMERMRQEVLQAEVSKVSLGAKHFDLFSRHIGVLRQLFAVEGKAEGLEAAFTVAELGIARVFLEQIGKSRAASMGRVSDALRRQETGLINRLRDLDARIANEQGRPLDRQDPQRLIRLFEERRRVEDEQLQLVTRMEREYPRYAALRYPRPCSLAEARACLGPNEVALLYVLGDEASYLIVVAKDDDPRTAGLAIHELGPAGAIAKAVDALVHPSALKSLRGLEPIPWEGEVDAREREAEAYRMLLAPAAEAIRGRDLVIVPGGPLGYLPFELLIEPREAKVDVADGRYLIERHRIRYAPSLTVLSLVRQWERTRARPDRPLGAVGDPVYEPSDKRVRGQAMLAQSSRGSQEEYHCRMKGPGDPMTFKRLEGFDAELQAIGQIMAAAPDNDFWTGLRASEALIKRASEGRLLAQYRYVHFATHGILGLDVGRQPSLVLSLVDNVGNDGREELGGKNDGFLQMDEVTHLHLNADLVVLSACQTGLGRLRNGEGVESLTRTFLYAGSRAVLCSLWSVADRETSELMADVYRNLKAGRSAPDALREAQLAMIKAGKPPFYWAPFITIGE
jgi:CHAT domain-containing protein